MKTCRNEKESLKKQYKKLQNQNLKKMLSGTNGPPQYRDNGKGFFAVLPWGRLKMTAIAWGRGKTHGHYIAVPQR